MTPEEVARARRWNERVRLLVSFFNLTSVGVFGLAIIAPMTDSANPLVYYWSSGGAEKVNLSEHFSLSDIIAWEAALGVVVLHVFAHILIGLTEAEE